MNSWNCIRLGDVCCVNTEAYSEKEQWDYVHYLDTGNITKNCIDEIQYIDLMKKKLPSRARRKVKYNSILYSTVRPNQCHYGIVKEQSSNFLVSTGFSVIDVIDERVDADFLYCYLTMNAVTEKMHAIAEQSTSAYPAIKSSDIEDLELKLPDILTQKRIASFLMSLEHKITNNTKLNKNLEEQVSAIYQAWFEDFSCSDGIRPYEWTMFPLADIADVTSGKRPLVKSTYQTKETPIPILGASSIMGFTSAENYSDHILVIGRVGTHGIVQRFNGSCWASDNTLVIRSKFYEYVNQILQRVDYHAMNRGSTQPLITQSDIKNVAVLLPDQTTLSKFEKIAASLMAVYEYNLLESTKLITLRDTLLPRLMSGELDVSNIEL